MNTSRRRLHRRGAIALFLTITMLAAGCGSGDEPESVGTARLGPNPVESGMPENPSPSRGGQLVYGVEAESDSWCLSNAQLAASGLEIVRAIFDPLTVPDAKGGYAPYLAKSLDHSPDYKTWTIELRDGIKFHDGSDLTATVVKNNLDAYRGKYEGRDALLFTFALANIADVTVEDELTVKVTTKAPWVAFPAALYNSGRIAIMAQAQLDASAEQCNNNPIGTGPFSFVSWTRDVNLKVTRNPNYWQKAPDGEPYPYLNAIEFRPVPNGDERIAALQQGELNMIHTSTASDIAENLPQLRDDGVINLIMSEERTELTYQMLNVSKPPFDKRDARIAAAQAIDVDLLNEKHNKGATTKATGAFAPEVLGYLDDSGYPEYDKAAAKKTVAKMKEDGRSTSFSILTDADPSSIRQAVILKEMFNDVGWTASIETSTQGGLIDSAIRGEFQMVGFRNQPGDDPDMDYLWWYGDANPVNFGRFNDPVINANLDKGRTSADPEVRKAAYEAINRQFGKEVWNLWLFYAPWAVAEARNVHGILGPDLPGEGGPATGRIVTGHPLHGIWIDQK